MFSEQNLISNSNTLKKFIDTCLDENIISIDTEFVRNKTFYFGNFLLAYSSICFCYFC